MLKIHVLFEHNQNLNPHGCSHIRLLLPLTYPTNAEVFNVSYSTTYKSADVVIVERTWKSDISSLKLAEKIVEQVRKDKACLIYTLDDNLLDLKKIEDPSQQVFTIEQLMAIRYFTREADAVIVSTEPLKERLLRLNKNIFVIPNALDERLITNRSSLTPVNNERKIIGYMGTYTHDRDIMMILQALRSILYKYGDIWELQLIGGIADTTVIAGFNNLPVQRLNIGNNGEYPDFMRWLSQNVHWDLAIAPLEDSPFTRCKSDIKFLDYSILGIPGIYSNVTPYEQTVSHLETGYLANNNPQAWIEAFECLLNDDALRKKMAIQAQEYVLSKRTLKYCASNWKNAIMSIVNQVTIK